MYFETAKPNALCSMLMNMSASPVASNVIHSDILLEEAN